MAMLSFSTYRKDANKKNLLDVALGLQHKSPTHVAQLWHKETQIVSEWQRQWQHIHHGVELQRGTSPDESQCSCNECVGHMKKGFFFSPLPALVGITNTLGKCLGHSDIKFEHMTTGTIRNIEKRWGQILKRQHIQHVTNAQQELWSDSLNRSTDSFLKPCYAHTLNLHDQGSLPWCPWPLDAIQKPHDCMPHACTKKVASKIKIVYNYWYFVNTMQCFFLIKPVSHFHHIIS